uniref:Reverse transcriptase zinc-binding domain-containing protein n=1 Tax=Nicotiana tabacum TaxID=4097 RepID=A0A1S4B4I5_TOBAC|nr:PREDICTED: uncharacterized protein LOC107804456 [Nicotiana tabacum]
MEDWEIAELQDLLTLLYGQDRPQPSCDSWRWGLRGDGLFTVKSFYQSILVREEATFPYSIWIPRAPTKVCFFGWLAARGVILTVENLRKRGITLNNLLPKCIISCGFDPILQLGLLVGQMVPIISPVYSMAQSASGDALRVLLDTAGTIIRDYDPETVVSLTKFADQLPLVFGELAQGISEFKPTPSENLECFKNSYNVKRTLLVKFDSDTIDETDRLEETLKPRVESFGGKVEKIALTGNHITPCIQEPKWRVGAVYTPADAVAQVVKTVALNDTKGLCTTIVNWFDRIDEF